MASAGPGTANVIAPSMATAISSCVKNGSIGSPAAGAAAPNAIPASATLSWYRSNSADSVNGTRSWMTNSPVASPSPGKFEPQP